MQPVRIYTTEYCGYCAMAKEFFRAKGIDYEEIDVTSNDELRAQLVEMSGGLRTVPQIFIGETHVGGYSDLQRIDSDGKLNSLLVAASAALKT